MFMYASRPDDREKTYRHILIRVDHFSGHATAIRFPYRKTVLVKLNRFKNRFDIGFMRKSFECTERNNSACNRLLIVSPGRLRIVRIKRSGVVNSGSAPTTGNGPS